MSTEKYVVKSLDNKEVELPENLVATFKSLDKMAQDLAEKVKGFEEEAQKGIEAMKERYISAFNQLNPEADEDAKAKAKSLADAYSTNAGLLQSEIDVLEGRVASAKAKQLNPKPKKEEVKKSNSQLNNWNR